MKKVRKKEKTLQKKATKKLWKKKILDWRKYWWYTEEWKGDRRWDTKEKEKYQKGRKDLIYEDRVYEIERERERI
jgi:hypothetical protein